MINLRLEEDGAYSETLENGVSTWRHITVNNLIKCLNTAIGEKVDEEIIASPLLPMGTIGYNAFSNETAKYDLFMFQPGSRTTLLYENRSFNDVGLPSTVYKFEVRQKHVKTSMWAVASDAVIRPDTPLYHYPVYNVADSGSLCMGSNSVVVNEPWELFKVPGMIKAMPATHAYASRNGSGLERDSLYKALQGGDFPDEWLTPAGIKLGRILYRS